MQIKILLIFFIVLNCTVHASKNKIDSLLNLSDNYINVNFNKSLQCAEEALSIAKKENSSKNRAQAYYYAAKSLVFFRQFEKSAQYIEEGLQEDALRKDIALKAEFLLLQSAYYSRMSLFEQSFLNLQKALFLLKSRNDLESQLLVSDVYIYLADYYTEMHDYKTAHLYSDKSITAIEKIPLQQYLSAKRIYKNKAFIYFYKSWIYLEQKEPDKAYPFIQKAYNQAIFDKIEYLALFYEIFGDYYYQINDYKKAIDFYLKAVDNKEKFGQYPANVDSKIATAYKNLGDSKNEVYYLKRAENRRKIDQEEYNKTFQKEMNRIVANENTEKKKIKEKNYVKIAIIVFAFALLLIIIILRYQKIRRNKRRIIGEQEIKISEKESKIQEREIEIEKLQQKMSESFSELSNMVKENSPLFWGRFQEIHPDFTQKMLKINSNLKVSELTFCAYIYLGFMNKEIAEYTFKAIRTIENNRYNLRKKLGLNSDEDLTVWIRKYTDET